MQSHKSKWNAVLFNKLHICLHTKSHTLQLTDNLVSSSWFLRLVSKRIIYDWICESNHSWHSTGFKQLGCCNDVSNIPIVDRWSSSRITYRHLLGDGWLLPVTQVLLYNRLVELTQDLCGCITFIHHVLTEDTFSMWECDVTICATHIHSMLTWGTHHTAFWKMCLFFMIKYFKSLTWNLYLI